MRELIRRAMRLWQRARRPGASSEEVVRAAEVIPELCSALDATLRELETAGCDGRDPASEADRVGRYVSHEVRNRLNLVELALGHADARFREPELRQSLEPVRRALRHLAAVTDDLRAAAVPAGAAGSERVEVPLLPLRSVVEDLVFASRFLAEEEGVRLEVDGELPEVEVDAARLELILVNLLTNAIRHADGNKPERWVRMEVLSATATPPTRSGSAFGTTAWGSRRSFAAGCSRTLPAIRTARPPGTAWDW